MNEIFLQFVLPIIGKNVVLTGWKIVGLIGALMFACRWFVQAWASKKAGRPVVPRIFWLMSVTGSALSLVYFIWGKNDAVGIIQNLSPFLLALYNVYLDFKTKPEIV